MPIDLIDNKKRGFTLPINKWMRRAEFLKELNSTEKTWSRLGLDKEAIQFINNQQPYNHKGSAWLRSWQILVLNIWAK